MTRTKIIVTVFLLLFVCVVAWAIRTVPEPPPPTSKDEKPKIMTYDQNTISEEKAGVKVWELTSDSMTVNADNQDAEMTNLTGHFFAEDGRIVTVTAKRGEYRHESRDIKIDGDVKITTSDGATLTADELLWTAKEELLTAKGNAVVTKDDMKATADRIESSNGFSHIKAIGKAHFEKGIVQ